MKLVKESWTIDELIEKRSTIDPKPQYQRTSVWSHERKAYLIDSILRGYDIPKFYFTFHDGGNTNGYEFEVADGQQRIRAIWEFYDNEYSLQKHTTINEVDLSLMKFNQLPEDFKNAFKNYELNVSNIISSTPGEVNELFTRLQKGMSLNPPELRHAMVSNIGLYINKYVANQKDNGFFQKDSKIIDRRFKHQDYIDHVITLVHFDNTRDLKAVSMTQLYLDFIDKEYSTYSIYFENATKVLKAMKEINAFKKGIFKNKWAFVDIFWLLYKNVDTISVIKKEKFAQIFEEFERDRIYYNRQPEKILELTNHKFGVLLYNYIQAFNKEGANKNNIKIRAAVLDDVFKSIL